ncbi:hypothetical protein AQUCO_02000240v1 [Aquilegia coerulea]|uniref:glutathione transferase n=1 Tax=Aquilegia coerulea TaxID=218851 RepID=A0A2G5DGL7_AQUCA|nr:hypothetical protein AQUCO_02000240v1 [Aquilegia coerulea]
MAKEDLKVLGFWCSPFYLRVLWALKIKGIEFEFVEEDIPNKSPLLLELNPVHKKVPVLVHNGKPIAESVIILQYVEDTWKHNPILPSDPHEKAMALFWAKFADEKLVNSIFASFIKQGKEKEEAVATVGEHLKFLEEELKNKKFFSGDEIGFLDLCLGWTVSFISVLDEINGLKMAGEERFPLFSAWIENFSNSPIVKDTLPPRDRLLSKLRHMEGAFRVPPTA